MPVERPGAGFYTVATKVTKHGAPCIENGIPGIAIKQKAPAWTAGLAQQDEIAIGESFHIRTKGVRQVPTVGGAVKGSFVYITPATNALAVTAPGAAAPAAPAVAYGTVVELAGQRGTPAGFMRVDLDWKPNEIRPGA